MPDSNSGSSQLSSASASIHGISNDKNVDGSGLFSVSSSERRSRITRTSDVSDLTMDVNSAGAGRPHGSTISRSAIYNPSQRGRFRNSSLSELTVNKLRFDKLDLHGRAREKRTIQTSLQRISDTNQLILISGESGVGKTALAKSVGKANAFVKAGNNVIDPSALCLLGNLHQAHAQQEPYAAFVNVFQQFVEYVLPLKESVSTEDQDKFKALQSDLITELGPQELSDLVSPFPELLEVLPSETMNEITTARAQHADAPDKVNTRLRHAFRNFLLVISRHFSPLVLILDDLQWADLASLNLLELILTDSKSSKTLIIGCYRSDEVDETHSFSKAVRDLRQRNDEFGGVLEITEIKIGNLGVAATRMILADLLSMEDDMLHDLAEVCYAKTNGNVFFLISFIIMLFNEQFLEFNLGTFKWKWDIQEIKGGTAAADNVADLVEVRMASLNNDILLAIKLAVCLGARFQYKILKLSYKTFCESSAQDFDVVVDNLLQENILQEDGWPYFRWVHDKIQEAASRLVPQDELKPLEKKVGEALLLQLSTEDLDSAIFVIANLYNDGSPPSTPEEGLKVAKINLKAAIHSAQRSAIEAASKYAATGINSLPDDKWESHSALSRSLYTIACRMDSCLGNHSRLEILSNEILDRKEIPLMERLPVSYAVLEMFESQDGRFPEAIDLCLDILRQLGCKFPKSPFGKLTGNIASVVKIKSTTKKLTMEVISEMKFMTDEKLIMTMKLLDKLGALCFISASPLFPMVVCRSLSLTLKHGLCESSPAAFALVGVLLVAAFADFQGGSVYASHAMGLMNKLPNGEAVESRVTFLSHFLVLPWTRPSTSMVKPMFRAYEIGLKTGDVDSAVYAIGTYVVIAIISGRPLQGLADDCRVYFGQMRELGRERFYVASKLCWQAILNLMGRAEDHLTFTGEAMNQDEYLAYASDPKNENNLITFYFVRSFLYAIFGEHELGAANAIANGKFFFEKFPGYPPAACCPYYMGISLIETARKTKKKIYKTHAKKMVSRINSYIKKGNPNVRHYQLALEAEMLVSKGQLYMAIPKFEAAITLATRSGIIHDSALINERYGEFLIHRMADEERGLHHLGDATRLYEEWGAQKKADMLAEKYNARWPSLT